MKVSIAVLLAVTVLTQCGCMLGDDLPPGLSDPSVEIRREAWRLVLEHKPENASDQVLAVLPQGLRDVDPVVRDHAVAAAGRIGVTGRRQNRFRLSDCDDVFKALLERLDDDRGEIRAESLLAITFGVEPNKELEETLITKYSHEKSPRCRERFIDALLLTSGKRSALPHEREPTDAVTSLIIDALDDPSETVRGAAARALGWMKTPPKDALPKLSGYLDASHPYACQFVISAIGRYGPIAKAYTSKLEQLRTQVETLDGVNGKVLRWNLENTIRLVNDQAKK